MSKTTDWYLELEENGTISLHISSTMFRNDEIEEIDYEEITEDLLTSNLIENDN